PKLCHATASDDHALPLNYSTTPEGVVWIASRRRNPPGRLRCRYRQEVSMNIERWRAWVLHPPVDGPRATVAIRAMAGGVFFWEGILKFVYVNQGIGRFTKLGMPFPAFTASFVGGLEIVGGLLLILGLGTRLIAIPFIVEMLVAMLSTKPALFLGTSPLPLPPAPPHVRFWPVLPQVPSAYPHLP